MRVGAQNCATACLRKGRGEDASDYHLNEDVINALTEGKSYKYLWIHQVITSEPGLIRDALMETYSNRLHQIWAARMSARTKVHATNTWAVSIFRYYFGSTLKWSKTYLRDLERKTRAILRKYRAHYRGASVERLYVNGKCGGRGFQNLTHVYQRQAVSAAAYLVSSDAPEHQSIVKHLRWMADKNRYSLLSDAERILGTLGMNLTLEEGLRQGTSVRKLIRSIALQQEKQLHDALLAKTIHGVFMKTSLKDTRDFDLTGKSQLA